MKMTKKFALLALTASLLLVDTSGVFATEVNNSQFTAKEIQILKTNGGLTDQEINEFPNEVLRELLDNHVIRRIGKGEKQDYNLQSESNEIQLNGMIQPLALTTSDMSITGN